MTEDSRFGQKGHDVPVAFVERYASRETFLDLFQDGMKLVEETASYLDGPGRSESKELSRSGTLTYTSESMRLTTRLMQMASWLLLQRAVREGEISAQQANSEKSRVNLSAVLSETSGPRWEELPEALRELILRSHRLQERLRHLDSALAAAAEENFTSRPSAVQQSLGLLQQAFGRTE